MSLLENLSSRHLLNKIILLLSVIISIIDLYILLFFDQIDQYAILFIIALLGFSLYSQKLVYGVIIIFTPTILIYRHILLKIPFRIYIDGMMTALIISLVLIFSKYHHLNKKFKIKSKKLEIQEKKLEEALNFLTVCAYCKKVKHKTEGFITWEEFISQFKKAKYTHGICPNCVQVVTKTAEDYS